MNISEAIRSAVATLRLQWLRTVLTLFGMVWGTASVVFLLSWGLGVERMLDDGFFRMGRNTINAFAGKIGEDFTPATDRRELWFTNDDIRALSRSMKLADLVVGEGQWWMPAAYGQKMLTVDTRGVEAAQREIRGVEVASGRWFGRADFEGRRRVAILGSRTRSNLLGAAGRVGQRIRLSGKTYEVIGILAPVGTQLYRNGDEIDDQIWIPLPTFQAIGQGRGMDDDVVRNIVARIRDVDDYDAAKEELRAVLARRLGVSPTDDEAVMIHSPIDFIRQMPNDTIGVTLFILAFTTLAIGGVGVLNMMLDSVQDRRREIGVRLAVGARRRDVLLQFFFETLTITALGGGFGLFLGVGSVWVLAQLHVPDLIPLPILRADVVWLAFGVMTAVGLLAGVVPAWRASRIEPSLALRAD